MTYDLPSLNWASIPAPAGSLKAALATLGDLAACREPWYRQTMQGAPISPLAIRALVDAIAGGSGNQPINPIGIYRTALEIYHLLADCGLDFRVTGSRVPGLTDYLRELSRQPNGQETLIRVIERVADPRDYQQAPERCQRVIEHLNEALEADGLEVVLEGKRVRVRRPYRTARHSRGFDNCAVPNRDMGMEV